VFGFFIPYRPPPFSVSGRLFSALDDANSPARKLFPLPFVCKRWLVFQPFGAFIHSRIPTASVLALLFSLMKQVSSSVLFHQLLTNCGIPHLSQFFNSCNLPAHGSKDSVNFLLGLCFWVLTMPPRLSVRAPSILALLLDFTPSCTSLCGYFPCVPSFPRFKPLDYSSNEFPTGVVVGVVGGVYFAFHFTSHSSVAGDSLFSFFLWT